MAVKWLLKNQREFLHAEQSLKAISLILLPVLVLV